MIYNRIAESVTQNYRDAMKNNSYILHGDLSLNVL